MEANIQVLIDKIYQDSIYKANSESEKIISKAREESERMIQNAIQEAEKIVEKAKSDARAIRNSTEADLKIAFAQVLSGLKAKIAELLSKKISEQYVRQLSPDIDFWKELLKTITEHWIQTGAYPSDIEVFIPESKHSEWNSALQSLLTSNLEGLTIRISDIQSGFQIQRTDKGFRIDFTEESITEFLQSFLRQKTNELLFQE